MSTKLQKPANTAAKRKAGKAAPEKTASDLDTLPVGGKEDMEIRRMMGLPDPTEDQIKADKHHIDCECHRCTTGVPIPPIHTRWGIMLQILEKEGGVNLKSEARREAWEWFRSRGKIPTVTMCNKSTALDYLGHLLYVDGNVLRWVKKGGR